MPTRPRYISRTNSAWCALRRPLSRATRATFVKTAEWSGATSRSRSFNATQTARRCTRWAFCRTSASARRWKWSCNGEEKRKNWPCAAPTFPWWSSTSTTATSTTRNRPSSTYGSRWASIPPPCRLISRVGAGCRFIPRIMTPLWRTSALPRSRNNRTGTSSTGFSTRTAPCTGASRGGRSCMTPQATSAGSSLLRLILPS